MRVCLFLDNLDKKGGGPARSVPVLAKGLAELEINVTLMVCQSDDMNTHALDGTEVKLVVIPSSISTLELEKIVVAGNFDIIHLQCVWLPIYHKMARIAIKNNIKYAISPRGCLEPWCYNGPTFIKGVKKHIAMCFYQRKDLNNSNMLFATADMEADNFRKLGLKSPISIIPNGIELDDYPTRNIQDKTAIRKQILFLSRISPKKGADVLIKAWANLFKKYPEYKVLIVGNGKPDYIDSLKKMIEKLGLLDKVSIMPPAFGKEKYDLYKTSSLFVLPTHSENFGMVIAEALSCGVPVITTMGTPWNELSDNNTGWWVKLTLTNIEKAICEALDMAPEELFNMGQKGAAIVKERYGYVSVAKKVKSVYEWMLQQSSE